MYVVREALIVVITQGLKMAEQLTSSTSLDTEPKRKRTLKGLTEDVIINFSVNR